MMSLQAALAVHQLQRVAADQQHRSEIWNKYQEAFSALLIGRTADYEAGTRHARRCCTIGIDKEQFVIEHDAFIELMSRALSLASRPHYQESGLAGNLTATRSQTLPVRPGLVSHFPQNSPTTR